MITLEWTIDGIISFENRQPDNDVGCHVTLGDFQK